MPEEEEESKETFLIDFLNPFSDCKSWIYWIIIAILLFIIIFL